MNNMSFVKNMKKTLFLDTKAKQKFGNTDFFPASIY